MNKENNRVEVSFYQQPKTGNTCNGDSFFYKETESTFTCVIADGLGSGEAAKESSEAVIRALREIDEIKSVESIINTCNDRLVNKRGVVLGVLLIDLETQSYTITSIGNVGIVVISPDGQKTKAIPSYGYLPDNFARFKKTHGQVCPGSIFLMYSDGVKERELFAPSTRFDDMTYIIEYYKSFHQHSKSDDSTLIAVKYK